MMMLLLLCYHGDVSCMPPGVVTVPHTAGTAQFVLRMLHKRFPYVCKDKCKEILRNGMLSHMNK